MILCCASPYSEQVSVPSWPSEEFGLITLLQGVNRLSILPLEPYRKVLN